MKAIILEKFGFTLDLPLDYFLATDEPGFMWIRKETKNTSTGIMVYTTEWNEKNPTLASTRRLRDSICRIYIPGPSENSYMITDTAYNALFYPVLIAGRGATVVRSLWRTAGDFMGGPFIALTIPDAESGRLITLEGFIYAPRFDKRNYMKQAEAIVYSFKPVEKSTRTSTGESLENR